jgi:sulfur carrier protein
MHLTVNGSPMEVGSAVLTDLLDQLGLQVGSVVVEHNGTALLRSEVLVAQLADGDVIELVRAVAGG